MPPRAPWWRQDPGGSSACLGVPDEPVTVVEDVAVGKSGRRCIEPVRGCSRALVLCDPSSELCVGGLAVLGRLGVVCTEVCVPDHPARSTSGKVFLVLVDHCGQAAAFLVLLVVVADATVIAAAAYVAAPARGVGASLRDGPCGRAEPVGAARGSCCAVLLRRDMTGFRSGGKPVRTAADD